MTAQTTPAAGKREAGTGGNALLSTPLGEDLPPIEIGPLTVVDFARYCMACGLPEPGEDRGAVHYDLWEAARAGFNDIFDMGAWRTALFVQFTQTRWGADAITTVERIKNRYVGMVYRNEILRFCGTVREREDLGAGGARLSVEIWNDKGCGPRVTTGDMEVVTVTRQ